MSRDLPARCIGHIVIVRLDPLLTSGIIRAWLMRAGALPIGCRCR
jgi:hypothetical protein